MDLIAIPDFEAGAMENWGAFQIVGYDLRVWEETGRGWLSLNPRQTMWCSLSAEWRLLNPPFVCLPHT